MMRVFDRLLLIAAVLMLGFLCVQQNAAVGSFSDHFRYVIFLAGGDPYYEYRKDNHIPASLPSPERSEGKTPAVEAIVKEVDKSLARLAICP
jgi:hypothetical protein